MALLGLRRVKYLLSRAYRFVLGESMTAGAQQFLRYLSVSFFGHTLSSSVLFLTVIVAGRLLGPEQFGLYALTVAVSQLLVIPMMLSMDVATMRGLAVAGAERASYERIVTSGFLVVSVGSLAIVVVLLASQALISTFFVLPTGVIRLSAWLAFAVSMRMFFDGVIRGQRKFRFQVVVRATEAFVVLGTFLLIYSGLSNRSYGGFVLSFIAGAVVAALVYYAGNAASFIRLRAWRLRTAASLWHYGKFGLLAAAGVLLLNSGEKLVIAQRLGTHALGIYAAYYFVSVMVASQFSYIFVNVLFPVAAGHRSKREVMLKLDRVLLLLALPAWVLMTLVVTVSLRLFSSAYDFSWQLVLGMSLYAVLFFVWQTYWWFIASTGRRGMVFTGVHSALTTVGYFLVLYWLIDQFGLLAPAMSFLLVFGYVVWAISRWRTSFLAESS